MHITRVLTGVFLLFLICLSPASAANQLIFAVDIIRHGDRSPVKDIPKSPYTWPQALGELTPEGMYQEYILGKAKAEQYKVQNHLLPDSYDRDRMLVRSTDFDRALMSADAFLLGLYPPSDTAADGNFALPYHYHPIPIHTVSLKQENLLISKLERFDALTTKYVYSQKVYQEKKSRIKNKLAQWQTFTGMDLSKTANLIYLADNLYVRKLHHVPMPAGITPAMADEIISLGQWFSLAKFAPYPIGISASKELLTLISKNFNAASQKNLALKYLLFSGHDDTILSMLSALHHPQTVRPRYASDLNFLLYKHKKGEFYVKVNFNDQPIAIPGCGENCRLADFNKLTAS
jgi:hypothetical protein